MIILGIDPGTKRVGYGVVKKEFGKIELLDAGLIAIKKSGSLKELKDVGDGVEKLIEKFKPEKFAIEKLYFAKNQKTGIEVSQSRGVVLFVALKKGLKVEEYSPNEVKAGVTGYGLADKRSILKMVKLILKEPGLNIIDDASDALAVAIMSANRV